jgi:hypothetical protein
MYFRPVLMCLLLVALPTLAAAQAPGGRDDDERSGRRERSEKMKACLEQGRAQNLRGPDLRDFASVCALEARLACLKQAVAAKARGPARKTFVNECMNKR